MLWSMRKSEVVATESTALNGEAAVTSVVGASDDRNSIVAARARLSIDGHAGIGGRSHAHPLFT